MSLARRIGRSIKRNKNNRNKQINVANIVLCVVSVIAVVSVCCMIYKSFRLDILFNVNSESNWNALTNNLGNINVSISEYDGIASSNEYMEIRRDEALKRIESISKIIGDKYEKYMINGVESDYFTGTVLLEYEQFVTDALELQQSAESINHLFSELIGDVEVVEHTCTADDCDMYKYINMTYKGDILNYMLDAHNKYEMIIRYYEDIVELSDDDIEYFYQTEICTNTDYIESITVDINIIAGKTLEMSTEDVQYAYEKGWLPKTKLTCDDIDAIKYLELYKDIDFYDNNIIRQAYVTMYSVFGEVNSNTKIINITDVENIDEYLKEMDIEEKEYEHEIITDMITYNTFSISDINKGEQIYAVFDVIDCKHKEVPSVDDIRSKVESTAKRYLAEQLLISDIGNHEH